MDLRHSALGRVRADRDDPPPPTLADRRGGGLSRQKRAFEVDVQCLIPVGLRRLAKRLDVNHTGGDHQSVQASKLADGSIDGRAHVAGDGDIGSHRDGRRPEFGRSPFERRLADVHDGNPGALGDQPACDLETEARRAAGHNC